MFRSLWQSETTSHQFIVAEYIWIDGTSLQLRSKSRTLNIYNLTNIKDIPDWSYDGSSTGQADVLNSELVLQPVFYCKDPFREEKGFKNALLVLCTTWKWNQTTPIHKLGLTDSSIEHDLVSNIASLYS